MQPLQDLLHRITWDPEFGKGHFALGFEDRIAHREIVVPFASVQLDPDRPGTLSFREEDGTIAHVPLHRVRAVYKDGVIIWQRRGR